MHRAVIQKNIAVTRSSIVSLAGSQCSRHTLRTSVQPYLPSNLTSQAAAESSLVTPLVNIHVQLQHEAAFGDGVQIVGSTAELGEWHLAAGCALSWSEGNIWKAHLSLVPGTYEFKCVTVRSSSGGSSEWEAGPNRVLQVPSNAQLLVVACQWQQTASTLVEVQGPAAAIDIRAPAEVQAAPRPALAEVDSVPETSLLGDKSIAEELLVTPLAARVPEPQPASHIADIPSTPFLEEEAFFASSDLVSATEPLLVLLEANSEPTATIVLQPDVQLKPSVSPKDPLFIACSPACETEVKSDTTNIPQAIATKPHIAGALCEPVQPTYEIVSAPVPPAPQPAVVAAQPTLAATQAGTTSAASVPPAEQTAGRAPIIVMRTFGLPESAVTRHDGGLSNPAPAPPATQEHLNRVLDAFDTVWVGKPTGGAGSIAPWPAGDVRTAVRARDQHTSTSKGGPVGSAKAAQLLDGSGTAGPLITPTSKRRPTHDTFSRHPAVAVFQRPSSTAPIVSPFAAVNAVEAQAAMASAEQARSADATVATEAAIQMPVQGCMNDQRVEAGQGKRALRRSVTAHKPELVQFDAVGNVPSLLCAAEAAARASATVVPAAAVESPMVATEPSTDSNVTVHGCSLFLAQSHAGSSFGTLAEAGTETELLDGSGALLEEALPAQELRLIAAAHLIPHIDKVAKGGEDAYFISTAGRGSIGVADGVSGWAEEGIDPAEYSRALMHHAAAAVDEGAGLVDPVNVIEYAQACTYMKGSSTVCMAMLKPGNKLEIANVGDSGVRIVRDGKILYASEAQQHTFNMPFQLSHPSFIEEPDSAANAGVATIDVLHGDVIVLATDGLFDNLFDSEVLQLVTDSLLPLSQRRGLVPTPLRNAFSGTAFAGGFAMTRTSGRRSALLSTARSDAHGDGFGKIMDSFNGWLGRGLLHPADAAAAAAAVATTSVVSEKLPYALYSKEHAAALAAALTEAAHRHASDVMRQTPWSVSLAEQGFAWARGMKQGGKMDDCTVVIAMITSL